VVCWQVAFSHRDVHAGIHAAQVRYITTAPQPDMQGGGLLHRGGFNIGGSSVSMISWSWVSIGC
jgi:hypothetical protein